jgi:hypothetical protein
VDAVGPGRTPGETNPTLFLRSPAQQTSMPATKEIECVNDDCELDMFENHYTYDVPDDHEVADLSCPYCGETETLHEIEL